MPGAAADGWVWIVKFTHLSNEVIQGAGNVGLQRADSSGLGGLNAAVKVAETVRGTYPKQIWLGSFDTGLTYYVRAWAFNLAGFGPVSSVSSVMPVQRPNQPAQPALAGGPR